MKRNFILAAAVLAAISVPAAFCEVSRYFSADSTESKAQPIESNASEATTTESTEASEIESTGAEAAAEPNAATSAETAETKSEDSTNSENKAEQANAAAAEVPAEAEIDPPNPESDFEIDFNEDVTEVYITKYIGKSDKIIIPETIQGLPVTRIKGSFDCDKIKKIFVPKSIKKITSSHVFVNIGCETDNGTEVILSEGLEYIGPYSFSSHGKISSINFPSSLKVICKYAFNGITIENVVLNEGLEYIGSEAFMDCNIKNLTLPASIKYFGYPTIFSMAPYGNVNLPKDTSCYRYDSGYYDSTDKKLTVFFKIHVDSQIATERRKQVELKKKLDAVTVKRADYNSFENFCNKYGIKD